MVQILIVDDDLDFREGLQLVLGDYYAVATTRGGPGAVAVAAATAPAVALIDPESGGLDVALQLKRACPRTRIILLSVFDRYLGAALDVGADGYLLKGCPVDELRAAIGRLVRPAGSDHDVERG